MKKITVQDIANELNLSRNTVTKALNGGAVSYETKLEVIKKAYAMGYSKLSEEAMQLLSKEKEKHVGKSVVVLMKHEQSPFWNRILLGLGEECNKLGYRMQLHIVKDQDLDGSDTLQVIDFNTAGIVFLCIFQDEFINVMDHTGLPMVFFDGPVMVERYLKHGNIVLTEGRYSMYTLVKKYIDAGKNEFAFIGDITYSKEISERFEGYSIALKEAGVSIREEFLAVKSVPSRYYRYDDVERAILTLPSIPEVFICANDDIAKYVYLYIKRNAPQYLEEIVITGFDNNIDRAIISIPIPTVTIRKEAVGKQIARILDEQIKEPARDHTITTVSTYFVEESDGSY